MSKDLETRPRRRPRARPRSRPHPLKNLSAITRGTERATKEFSLRSSIVSPITRENRQTSTGEGIPIIHYDFVQHADFLNILFMPKGSGSENMSFLKMLVPADGLNGIKQFV